MTLAERIREYVRDEIIEPARHAGQMTVEVRAGNVHELMQLHDRMPAVCGALDAEVFLGYARVNCLQRVGPQQGGNATWIFGSEQVDL